MDKKLTNEPRKKWNRKDYNEDVFSNLDYRDYHDRRKAAEIETGRDLNKCVEQLVCDVHEEILYQNRSPLQNIAGAQQRMVSMMAKIAKSNNRTNIFLLIFTIAMVIIAFLSFLKL